MSYSNKTHVILIKDHTGEWRVRTEDVCQMKDDEPSMTCFVYFNHGFESDKQKGKLYQYSQDNVIILKNPIVLNPFEYTVFYHGELQDNVYVICHFEENLNFNYWTIAFQDSRPDIVCKDDKIRLEKKTPATATPSRNTLKYLTQMCKRSLSRPS